MLYEVITLIADQVDSVPEDKRFNAWMILVQWYLALGHLDRYFEIIQSLDEVRVAQAEMSYNFV